MGDSQNKAVEWDQLVKEAAIEREDKAVKTKEAELLAAYDDIAEDIDGAPRSKKLDKEIADDWQKLKRVAMTQFPEGSQILGLTPRNRMVAVAHCLGWSFSKISKATGVATSTVSNWVNQRPDIKHFINEFNLRNSQSGKDIIEEKFPSLEYKAVAFIDSLISDKDDTDAAKRLKLDATKWIFERSRGKPDQAIEHRGAGLKDLLKLLGESKNVPLTKEEEKEVFSIN